MAITLGPFTKHMNWACRMSHPKRLQVASADNLARHVLETFCNVLSKRGVTCSPQAVGINGKVVPCGKAQAALSHRDQKFELIVTVQTKLFVYVCKLAENQPFPDPFFRYTCPHDQLGALKRTALILFKKIDMSEIFEVMNS
jgi:hypothetical protein